jgi:hypothetical protein
MVKWAQSWNPAAHRMERSCSHNIEHPDPDDINPEKQHQCDGCCSPFKDDFEELTKTYEKPDYLTPTSLGVNTGVHLHIPTRAHRGVDTK